MIFLHKPSLRQLNTPNIPSMVDHLGIEFTAIGDEFLEATMPVDYRTIQPYGLLHGGASVVLAETMGSVAASLTLDLEKKNLCWSGNKRQPSQIRKRRKGKRRCQTNSHWKIYPSMGNKNLRPRRAVDLHQ